MQTRRFAWACVVLAAASNAPAARADDYLDEVDRGTRWQKPVPLTSAEASALVSGRLAALSTDALALSKARQLNSSGGFDASQLLAPERDALRVESMAPAIGSARAGADSGRPRLSRVRGRLSATAEAARRAVETTRAERRRRLESPSPGPDALAPREEIESAIDRRSSDGLRDLDELAALLRSAGAESDPELPRDASDIDGRRALDDLLTKVAFSISARVPAAALEGGGPVFVARPAQFNLKDLASAGLTLRRKFGPTADKNFASLKYNRDITEGVQSLDLEACLRFQKSGGLFGPDGNSWRIDPVLAIDGNLTSSDANDSNFWSLRAGAAFRWDGGPDSWSRDKPTDRHIRRLATYVVGTYTESQDGDVRQLYADVVLNPVFGPWALGVRRGHESVLKDECGNVISGLSENGCCLTPGNWISGQWNIEAHVRAGENLETGNGKNRESLILGGVATLSATVYFDGIGRALGAGWDSKLYPYVEFAYDMHWKPNETDTYDDLYQVTFKFPFNPDVALAATYRNGVYGPKLKEVNQIEVSLTFGF